MERKERGEPYHFGKAARGDDVASVNEAVQMSCGFLNRLAHLVVAVEIKDIGDEVQRILVVLDFRVQAGEVEAIGQVFLVDFAEVFVAAG